MRADFDYMCGIAGATRTTDKTLKAMRERMGHRGPDAQGQWREDKDTGLAHTRLAVIDLSSSGAQPMVSACGRYVLAYNGEIYNFRELRQELEAKGRSFSSTSDTEVLLSLLEEEGEGAIAKLVGMFAFALWDRRDKNLLLVRDRLGIKPLVYGRTKDGHIAFASEIHALKSCPDIEKDMDGQALSAFLACLYVPAPLSIHKGIRKLPPGHLLRWKKGKVEIERYWAPAYGGREEGTVEEAAEVLLPLVRQAVVQRMVADVPVGCFLSGGIDSSVIAALMAEEAKKRGAPPIKTFTMTFDVAAYDEREAARAVSDHIGSHHQELPAASTLVDLLDPMIEAFGEPFGNPTALLIDDLSRKAREHVTVALVGDGGDEVFGGYPRYQGGLWAEKYRRLPGWLRNGLFKPLSSLIPESTQGRHSLRRLREFVNEAGRAAPEAYAAWVEYFSPEDRQTLLGLKDKPPSPIADLYPRDLHALDAMQQTDLLSFLPYNLLAYGDAMSMRHALELRLPLIDHRLVEAVGRMSADLRFREGKKTLLKAVARRLLPGEIVDRPKRGFNPPMGAWLKTDLAALLAERVTEERMTSLGIAWGPVERLLTEHRRGLRDHSLKIWALLVFERWATREGR